MTSRHSTAKTMLTVLVPTVLYLTTILSSSRCLTINPDEVTSLPGLTEKLNFKQYSGYLAGRDPNNRLHYWFFESQNDPKSDPVLLWLNGGPGCSSLMGMISENGPFLLQEDGRSLKLNPYSWNGFSSVIYLEAPVGVGFSYNTKTPEYPTGDEKSAEDNYYALQDFFTKYPDFSENDFYICGESYGSIYGAILASKIQNGSSKINLKGLSIGNGLLDRHMNKVSRAFYLFYHGLIDHGRLTKVVEKCCHGSFDLFGCINPTDECHSETSIMRIGLVDPYNIYNACPNSLSAATANEMDFGVSQCVNSSTRATYFNDGAVRRALHVGEQAPAWKTCRRLPFDKETSSVRGYITSALKDVRVLLYHGDFDTVCNVIGGEWFSSSLGLPLVSKMAPFVVNRRTAGRRIVYENLTFVSIKGAGHMVPSDKPEVISEVLKSFLRKSTFLL